MAKAKMVTIAQAAEQVDCSVATIRGRIKADELAYEKIDGKYMIKASDLKGFKKKKPGRPKKD